MAPFSPEGQGESIGPNASIAGGQAGAETAALHNFAPGAYKAASDPGAQSPLPGGLGGGTQSPGPAPQAVQGPPTFQDAGTLRTPDGKLDMGKVFSDLTVVPTWRQRAQTWASHPEAGYYLKLLGRMAGK